MCTLVSSLVLLLEETFSALLYFIRFIHCLFYFISADLGPFLGLFGYSKAQTRIGQKNHLVPYLKFLVVSISYRSTSNFFLQ